MADVRGDPRDAPAGRRRFLVVWLVHVTTGEVVAFGVPIALLAALAAVGVPDAVFFVVAVAGGAAEGAILGWFQARALVPALVGLAGRDWVRATAVGAAVAWAAAMAPSQLRPVLEGRETFLLGTVMLVLIAIVLLSVGVAQWFVLRWLVDRAGTWIWVSAVASFLALLAAAPVWSLSSEGQAVALRVAIGGAGGLVMAFTMALFTGLVLRSMVRRGPPHASWQDAWPANRL